MIPRYSTKALDAIWSDENKFLLWLVVEFAILRAKRDLGMIPKVRIPRKYDFVKIDPAEIKRIEDEITKHDVIAFLTHVSPQLPEVLRPHFHAGVTSYDPGDTATCLQMRETLEIIIGATGDLMGVLKERAYEFKNTPQIGRTHGVHAEPITFGVKLANWYAELARHIVRLENAHQSVSVGKISGAVGMYTLDPEVERKALQELGLRPIVATQIISRDIVGDYVLALAHLAASLGKIATNLRLFAQTEIREVMEPFGKTQKGSSAMPHKKNPITFEKVSSLTRAARSWANVALDNLAKCWNERSLDNSANERLMLPDIAHAVHHSLSALTSRISGMIVYPDRMMRNLNMLKGLIFSQEVMMLVAEKSGLPREEAHTLVRDIAVCCFEEELDFLTELLADETIMEYVSESELRQCFSLENKLKHVDHIFEMVFGTQEA